MKLELQSQCRHLPRLLRSWDNASRCGSVVTAPNGGRGPECRRRTGGFRAGASSPDAGRLVIHQGEEVLAGLRVAKEIIAPSSVIFRINAALAHPSQGLRRVGCSLDRLLAVGAGGLLGMNDAVAGATVRPNQQQHVLISRRRLHIVAELLR